MIRTLFVTLLVLGFGAPVSAAPAGEFLLKLQGSALPPWAKSSPPVPTPRPELRPVITQPQVLPPRVPVELPVASKYGGGIRRFFGHHDEIQTVDISPNGKVLATGGADHTLRLWDLQTGAERARLTRPGGNLERVRFLSNGTSMISVSKKVGSGIAVWDVDTALKTPAPRPEKVLSVGGGFDEDLALHPSGAQFATGGYKKVIVLQLPEYAAVAELPVEGSTTRLRYTPDGTTLVVGNSDGQVTIWDTATWARKFTTDLPQVRNYHGGRIQGIDIREDGSRAFVTSSKQWAELDLGTGEWVGEPSSDWEGQASALRPGDHVQAISDYVGKVLLVDPIRRRELATLRGHRDGVNAMRWLPNGNLVTVSDDGTAVLWEVASDEVFATDQVGYVAPAILHYPPATSLPRLGEEAPRMSEKRLIGDLPHESIAGLAATWSPDGSLLASGYSGKLRLYRRGESKHFLERDRTVTRGFAHAFHPDGSKLLYIDRDHVRMLSVPDGAELGAFPTPGKTWPNNVAVSPDGTGYLLTHGHGKITTYDLKAGVERRTIEAQLDVPGASETRLYGVAFSPDGDRVLVGGTNRVAHMFDLSTGAEVLRLVGHEHTIRRVAFLPDGRMVTASMDKTVRWWHADGKPGPIGAGHTAPVLGLTVHANLVITGGRDGALLFWDATTGRKLLRLDTESDDIDFLAVSPDGAQLVVGGDNSGQRSFPMDGLRALFSQK